MASRRPLVRASGGNRQLPSGDTLDASVTGNAATATKLAAARTLSWTGDVTGSTTFDGSGNSSAALTLAASGVTAGTYPKVTINAKGLVTGGAALAASDIPSLNTSILTAGVLPIARGGTGNANGTSASWSTARTMSFTGDATGSVSLDGSADVSAVLTLPASGATAGTYAKVTITAKGLVTAGAALAAGDIPSLSTDILTSGVLPAARGGTGNANGTAAALTTARTLSLTGDGTASLSFNGSANVSGAFTLANSGVTAGTFGAVTVNAKGLVTAGSTVTPVANGGTGNTNGTASAWTTPRALTAIGSVIGSVTMDGSSAVAMSLAAAVPGMRNRLINGNMLINQRAFGGGALAAGVYGYDRWKAGSGGANFSVSAAGVITHNSGPAVQVIEDNNASDLAGNQVTISVEDPSAAVSVSLAFSATNTNSVSGSIPAGSGRQSVTLTLPAGTGNLTLTLSASSATYKRVQLEPGAVATAWDHRPRTLELVLCERYYWQGLPWASGINTPIYTSGGYQSFAYSFPATMRTTPAMTISNSSWSTGNLNTNFGTNGIQVSPNVNGFRILVQSSAAASNCYVDWSGGGYFAADAEL